MIFKLSAILIIFYGLTNRIAPISAANYQVGNYFLYPPNKGKGKNVQCIVQNMIQ